MACRDDRNLCLADHVLSHLDKVVRRRDGQYGAACPAHEDRHSSLEIGLGTKGARFLIKCQHKPACTLASIRTAMIARGVHDECLPRATAQRTEDQLRSDLIEIRRSIGPGRKRDLLEEAVLSANGDWPLTEHEQAELCRLAQVSPAQGRRVCQEITGELSRARGRPNETDRRVGRPRLLSSTTVGPLWQEATGEIPAKSVIGLVRKIAHGERLDRSMSDFNGPTVPLNGPKTAHGERFNSPTPPMCDLCGQEIPPRADGKPHRKDKRIHRACIKAASYHRIKRRKRLALIRTFAASGRGEVVLAAGPGERQPQQEEAAMSSDARFAELWSALGFVRKETA